MKLEIFGVNKHIKMLANTKAWENMYLSHVAFQKRKE